VPLTCEPVSEFVSKSKKIAAAHVAAAEAILKQKTGRLGEAESLFNELVNSKTQVLGAEHPNILYAPRVVHAIRATERFADAERLARVRCRPGLRTGSRRPGR